MEKTRDLKNATPGVPDFTDAQLNIFSSGYVNSYDEVLRILDEDDLPEINNVEGKKEEGNKNDR